MQETFWRTRPSGSIYIYIRIDLYIFIGERDGRGKLCVCVRVEISIMFYCGWGYLVWNCIRFVQGFVNVLKRNVILT